MITFNKINILFDLKTMGVVEQNVESTDTHKFIKNKIPQSTFETILNTVR